jgi:hypothetical protein
VTISAIRFTLFLCLGHEYNYKAQDFGESSYLKALQSNCPAGQNVVLKLGAQVFQKISCRRFDLMISYDEGDFGKDYFTTRRPNQWLTRCCSTIYSVIVY